MIIIFGLPGVGKTTIISKVFENTNILRKYQYVNYGNVLQEIAGSDFKTRDSIRNLTIAEQKQYQKKVFPKINAMDKQKEVVLDTHAFIKTPEGVYDGIPIDLVKPRMFIIISAQKQMILQRMQNDRTRDRSDFVKNVNTMLEEFNSYINKYSKMFNVPIETVDNSGTPEQAVAQLKNILLKRCGK